MTSPTSSDDGNVPGGLLGEQEALRELALRLYALIPPGFDRAEFSVTATKSMSEGEIVLLREDGEDDSIPGDFEVSDRTSALRQAMYRPGSGTWFSAKISVTSTGKVDASYNYDNEPYWDFPVDPKSYVTDLKAYPRDGAHIPEWLQEKVRNYAEGKTR